MHVKVKENKNKLEPTKMNWDLPVFITTNLDGVDILQKLGPFLVELNTYQTQRLSSWRRILVKVEELQAYGLMLER